jgi:hypothetical protein
MRRLGRVPLSLNKIILAAPLQGCDDAVSCRTFVR